MVGERLSTYRTCQPARHSRSGLPLLFGDGHTGGGEGDWSGRPFRLRPVCAAGRVVSAFGDGFVEEPAEGGEVGDGDLKAAELETGGGRPVDTLADLSFPPTAGYQFVDDLPGFCGGDSAASSEAEFDSEDGGFGLTARMAASVSLRILEAARS